MKKKLIILLFIILASLSFSDTIKLWHGWRGKTEVGLDEIIEKYKQVSGNDVEVLKVPFDSLQGKFQVMTMNEEGPDLLFGPADWMGSFATQGFLEPLGEYVDKEDLKNFIEPVVQGSKYKGEYYGLPVACNVAALIYNKDLIPEPPLTTKQMIRIGKEITNIEETMYGLIYDYGNYYYHIPWVGGYGGSILDENNNPTFTSKAQIDAANFLESLINGEDKIMPDEADYNIMMTLFLEGRVGMIINGSWVLNDLLESGMNIGISRLPMVSETGRWAKPIVGPELVMMSKASNNKEKAYDLMKYFISQDSQALMVEMGNLPVRYDVYEFKKVKENKMYPLLAGYLKQSEIGVAMPTEPEMGAGIWSNGAVMLSGIINGIQTVEAAAKEAQEKAQESIDDFRNN